MAVTASAAAAKWQTNLSASTQRITDGVNAVTTAPGLAAARQADVWLANLQASASKWKSKVAAVSLQDWQQAMTTKGVPRIASGAQAAQPKMESFLNKFLPHVYAGKAGLPPRGNLEQNINRMVQMVRHNAKFSMGQG